MAQKAAQVVVDFGTLLNHLSQTNAKSSAPVYVVDDGSSCTGVHTITDVSRRPAPSGEDGTDDYREAVFIHIETEGPE